MGKIIYAADLFCGAGGTSTGLALAAEQLGLNLKLTAINHWARAIQTHSTNHPWANHICTGLDGLKPSKVIPGGKLDLLVASPECTHHSVARGGKPMDDQSRASAWHVLHWAQELYVRNILIENVPEFMEWGPLGADKKPLKSKKGSTFHAFVNALRSLGYRVDHRIINCANFGDATTRRRFFLFAQRGNRRPVWPEFTHGENLEPDIFGQSLKPWKPAKDVIDWNNPGHSIFLSQDDVKKAGLKIKRPLAENTLRRIAIGIERYWGDWAKPFLVMLYGTNDVRMVERPLATVTANGGHIGLCRPFIIPAAHSSDAHRVRGIDQPLSTIVTKSDHYMVQPLILPQDARGKVRTVDEALPTIATAGAHAMIEPFIVGAGGSEYAAKPRSCNVPFNTVLTNNRQGVVQPFIVKYYGTGKVTSIDAPLDTVTADDRFGLVKPVMFDIEGEKYLFDILFRMLAPDELAAAHSFPQDYKFAGTKTEVVRQIGNSVPVETSKALCKVRLAA